MSGDTSKAKPRPATSPACVRSARARACRRANARAQAAALSHDWLAMRSPLASQAFSLHAWMMGSMHPQSILARRTAAAAVSGRAGGMSRPGKGLFGMRNPMAGDRRPCARGKALPSYLRCCATSLVPSVATAPCRAPVPRQGPVFLLPTTIIQCITTIVVAARQGLAQERATPVPSRRLGCLELMIAPAPDPGCTGRTRLSSQGPHSQPESRHEPERVCPSGPKVQRPGNERGGHHDLDGHTRIAFCRSCCSVVFDIRSTAPDEI